MASSSSSSTPPPRKITIVAAPIELVVIETDEDNYKECIQKLASDFQIPEPALFASGLVKMFSGVEIPVSVKSATVDVHIP